MPCRTVTGPKLFSMPRNSIDAMVETVSPLPPSMAVGRSSSTDSRSKPQDHHFSTGAGIKRRLTRSMIPDGLVGDFAVADGNLIQRGHAGGPRQRTFRQVSVALRQDRARAPRDYR